MVVAAGRCSGSFAIIARFWSRGWRYVLCENDQLIEGVKACFVVGADVDATFVTNCDDGSEELRASAATGGAKQCGANSGALGVMCG